MEEYVFMGPLGSGDTGHAGEVFEDESGDLPVLAIEGDDVIL